MPRSAKTEGWHEGVWPRIARARGKNDGHRHDGSVSAELHVSGALSGYDDVNDASQNVWRRDPSHERLRLLTRQGRSKDRAASTSQNV